MRKKAFANKFLISAVVALVLVVGAEALFLLVNAADAGKKPNDPLAALWSGNYKEERDRWQDELSRLETEDVYETFKKENAGKQFGIAHTLAHIMGELIYEKEGIAGVAYCDSTFAFGCYHSFFGKAISENGIEVVTKLDQACIDRWGEKGLGCPHGIGHGVMGSLGDERLVEALEVCETLNWKEPIGGCTSGVFMEFNFHTMQSLNGVENRAFDPSDPHYPCNAIPARFGQACYFEQPQWWVRSGGGDYARAGRLCAEVEGRSDREACFRGLGNTVGPDSAYDAARSIAGCELMPDEEGALLCKEGASWSFFAEPSARDRAGEVCEGVSPEKKRRCMSGFDLAGDRV